MGNGHISNLFLWGMPLPGEGLGSRCEHLSH
jgi:hypothetical protein